MNNHMSKIQIYNDLLSHLYSDLISMKQTDNDDINYNHKNHKCNDDDNHYKKHKRNDDNDDDDNNHYKKHNNNYYNDDHYKRYHHHHKKNKYDDDNDNNYHNKKYKCDDNNNHHIKNKYESNSKINEYYKDYNNNNNNNNNNNKIFKIRLCKNGKYCCGFNKLGFKCRFTHYCLNYAKGKCKKNKNKCQYYHINTNMQTCIFNNILDVQLCSEGKYCDHIKSCNYYHECNYYTNGGCIFSVDKCKYLHTINDPINLHFIGDPHNLKLNIINNNDEQLNIINNNDEQIDNIKSLNDDKLT